MSIVELRYGDMFDGPSDLIVLPCSTSGSVTDLVHEKLVLYNISYPKPGMKLGDLFIKPHKCGENISQYIAFAASVTEPSISSLHAIRQIGLLLGRETHRNRAIRRIAAPLLGAGAGELQPELAASSLRDGFSSGAHEDSTLTISVLERGIFELVCCHYPDLARSVSNPESLATLERSGYKKVRPTSSHTAVERTRQMATAGAGGARSELGAHVVKPPVPAFHPDQTSSPRVPSSPFNKHTILFLAANPVSTDRLALDEEARAIRVALERSRHRDQFHLEMRGAARPLDLLDELRKLKPTVVHFSGHGGVGDPSGTAWRRDIADEGTVASEVVDRAPSRGLSFQGPDGDAQLVSIAAIQQTFGAAGASVKLVVLNACHSEAHAEALLAHVGCIVGIRGSIGDDAARSFAIGCYGALGDGESVAAAYRHGCAAIGLEGVSGGDKPRLRVRDGVDAELLVLADLALGDPAARSRGLVSPPMPAYANAEVQALSMQLENARARREALRNASLTTDEVDREILRLRRQLREGGQLRGGDALSDGRHLLIRILGRGGFAVVWEAWDRAEQRRVAIKVLHANLAGDVQRRERFFRGAQAMMKLRHRGVVHVLEPEGEDGGFYYFVMEFVPSGNLREAVLKKRVQPDDVLPLILQVGEALTLAHASGMIHRDVKPANILLDEQGNAKLTDFDLVGAHDTTGGTRTGALGTVVYAAPECLDKPQNATVRADVFGLGMTAIFCLSGQDLTMDTLRDTAEALAQLNCTVSVRKVLERAVEWKAERRFADAAAMVEALRDAVDGSSRSANADDGRAARMTPTAVAAPTPVVITHPVGRWRSDDDGAVLRIQQRPRWATASGKDNYGDWAEFQVKGVTQRMRWIPPGAFLMGSPPLELGRYENEGPQHAVTLSRGYWLGETPVTQALWATVMGFNRSRFRGNDAQDLERPVERVSWDECQMFVERLNNHIVGLAVRLPTEAEWEYAARAMTTGPTWVGQPSGESASELDAIAWYLTNSSQKTHPVGRKAANPYGLHDVLGNVSEWCHDHAHEHAAHPYAVAPATDPVSPSDGPYRAYRGGSWYSGARGVRAAYRVAASHLYRGGDLGFRLAADQVPLGREGQTE